MVSPLAVFYQHRPSAQTAWLLGHGGCAILSVNRERCHYYCIEYRGIDFLITRPMPMSATLNGADTSTGTHPDFSLYSFVSGFSTPGRPLRVPSLSSPSPSSVDVAETPVARAQRPRQSIPSGIAAALSLRDQEKVIPFYHLRNHPILYDRSLQDINAHEPSRKNLHGISRTL